MRYTTFATTALFGSGAFAFPRLPAEFYSQLQTRQDLGNTAPGAGLSQKEGNCGPRLPCPTFSEKDQAVKITGQYAYKDPVAGQIRGPCPGLNAASNHGYLPRDGVASLLETVAGLGALYNMSPDLSGFLAAYAIVLDGDLISQTWSIGGPPPYVDPTGLLTPPQGISYSHNKYEGDTSIGRNDAYLANGDAYSLNVTRFGYAFARGQDDGSDRYTLDKFRRDVRSNQRRSIRNNPYYFAPLFSTTLVAPAAYNFIINFMSNHSAENPNGYLNGKMFKQFFAVSGTYDKSKPGFGFKWLPGKERVPNNWYRRPTYNQYNAADVILDLAIGWAAYPDTLRFGGNTNGVNTYKGVDVATLTGGSFSQKDLFTPRGFGCLLFQTQQQAVPDQIKGGVNALAPALQLIAANSGFLSKLNCPKLSKYDSSVFNSYPGRNYSPKAPCTTVGC